MVRRLLRDTAIAGGAMALLAWAWMPSRPQVAVGVVGGAALVGIIIWALGSLVERLGNSVVGDAGGESRGVSEGFLLVKFFTRHAILAAVAYVMMVRLHLDPVGMLVGVTSVVVAAICEATRAR